MFKYVHKITPYLDESRIDNRLSKKNRNCRYKDKVLYINDETIFWFCENKTLFDQHIEFYYKYEYVVNDKVIQHSIKTGSGKKLKYGLLDNSFYLFYKLKNSILHRSSGPAVITLKYEIWYKNGLIHRNKEPAIICELYSWNRPTGEFVNFYIKNEKLHRDNGPAYIKNNGYEEFWDNGKFIKYNSV